MMESIEDIRDLFRECLLEMLDKAAKEAFDCAGSDGGASDADLPRLFAALDIQIDVLVKRHRSKKAFVDKVLCTCRSTPVHATDIDPPETITDPLCPLHGDGGPDPDHQLETKREDRYERA
jgi:hypothetical protein